MFLNGALTGIHQIIAAIQLLTREVQKAVIDVFFVAEVGFQTLTAVVRLLILTAILMNLFIHSDFALS